MAFPDTGDPQKELSLIDEINRLRTVLRQQCRENNLYDLIRQEAFEIAKRPFVPPSWLIEQEAKHKQGIPTLFLSDWHWGEVVVPSEINWQNEYNLQIAHQRAKQCFEEFIRIYYSETRREWDGLVVLLGGDMVSGDIHEELAQTNESPTLPTVLDCSKQICAGLELLSKYFERIIVLGVVGNHGRSTESKRYKKRVSTNYDWMIYSIVERHFAHDESFSFHIPDGSDCYYCVYDTRYLLTHGDQLGGRTTDPIIGAMNSISGGDRKRRQRQMDAGKPYDVLLCGHWHQLGMLPKRIINGNLKGVDEYSYGHGFAPERPQQASWVTEPGKGITSMNVIHCD
tara:strand:+ start:1270 stop:2292 length:1023 start_codon:yes stop_codon:yes gene_type:complete